MIRSISFAVVVLVCLAPVAQAVPTITVPDVTLQLNQAGQVVNISVAGGDLVPGVDFVMQVASPTGPIISSVDIIGPGTIFNASNTGQGNLGPILPGRIAGVTTTTIPSLPASSPGFVPAAGTLAIVTFDTTGIAPGVYLYRMTAVDQLGDTNFTVDGDGEPILANFSYTTTDPSLPTFCFPIRGVCGGRRAGSGPRAVGGHHRRPGALTSPQAGLRSQGRKTGRFSLGFF